MRKVKHFMLLDHEYVIDPEFRKVPKKRVFMLGLLALYGLHRLRSAKKSSSGGGGGRQRHYRVDTRQRCTVKMRYSDSMEAHRYQLKKYLTREGVGNHGERPTLYGCDLAEYQRAMVDRNFRIFISPESPRVPLDAVVRSFIKKIELETGYSLWWVATEHYNTAHPHAHILINGVDKQGRAVFFQPDLVRHFMRSYARDSCTSLIGSRTREDLKREKIGICSANRYTYLDTALRQYIVDGVVDYRKLPKNKEPYLARIDHLKRLGLCTWDAGAYRFTRDWGEVLQTMGRHSAFLRAREALVHTPKHLCELYDATMGKQYGRVSAIYAVGDDSSSTAILVESPAGKAYFVPVSTKTLRGVSVGSYVVVDSATTKDSRPSIRTRPVAIDEIIAYITQKKLQTPLAHAIITSKKRDTGSRSNQEQSHR